MKLIIGNKNYSSWSLRGWLAAKQSGLSFEELTVHIDGDDWQATRKQDGEFQPSAGKVPVLWDGETVVWDSLAILEYLADKVKASELAATLAKVETQARKHPAAYPEIHVTSAEKGMGIPELRAAILADASV